MARELNIRIQVQDSEQARAALAGVEQGLQGVERAGGQVTKTVGNETSPNTVAGSLAGLKRTLAGLGIGLAIERTIEWGSKLSDLSAKTGIGTDALQRFEKAGGLVGVSLDQMANGVLMLQRRLTTDKGAIQAVEALGLKTQDLLRLKPDEMFVAIATAVGKIEDPAKRTTAAYELMGRSSAELIPVMVGNLETLTKRTNELTDEQIRNLDALDDAWSSLKLNVLNYIGGIIGSLGSWQTAVARLAQAFTGVQLPQIMAGWRAIADGIKTAATTIVRYVQALYQDIKTWMVDKFESIVSSVKAKVAAIGGFFGDMYDKVVGNSYVPDMVIEVGEWFERLDDVMVRPSSVATSAVVGHFKGLSSDVSRELGNLIGMFVGPGGFKEKAINFASDFARGFVSTALDIMVPGLGQLVNIAWPLIEMGLSKIWDGIQAFWGKVKGFFNFFGQGTGAQTPVGDFNPNDPNNPFYGREDPGNPNPTPSLPEGPGSGDMYVPSEGLTPYEEYLRQRQTVYGFAQGTGGKFLDFGAGTPVVLHGKERVMTEGESDAAPAIVFNVYATVADKDSLRQLVYGDIQTMLKDALSNNTRGARTQFRQALGVA